MGILIIYNQAKRSIDKKKMFVYIKWEISHDSKMFMFQRKQSKKKSANIRVTRNVSGGVIIKINTTCCQWWRKK